MLFPIIIDNIHFYLRNQDGLVFSICETSTFYTTVRILWEYSCCIYGLTGAYKLFDTLEHELIGIVRDGKDVGRGLNPLFASVSLYNHWVIHREPLVGVHGDTEQSWVGLWRERSFTVTCLPVSMFWFSDVTTWPNSRRSSMLHSALWGYTAQRARWGGSSWPCPQSYQTWEGSWGRLQCLWQW